MLSVELSSCSSCHVFRQYFASKRVKCSETIPSFCSNYQNNSTSSLGFLCQRFNNLQPGCTFDVILTWSVQYDKILSKVGQQQLVVVNYAGGFKQSETGKYFEWIIIINIIIEWSWVSSEELWRSRRVWSTSALRPLLKFHDREFKIRRLRTTNYGWTSVILCL